MLRFSKCDATSHRNHKIKGRHTRQNATQNPCVEPVKRRAAKLDGELEREKLEGRKSLVCSKMYVRLYIEKVIHEVENAMEAT